MSWYNFGGKIDFEIFLAEVLADFQLLGGLTFFRGVSYLIFLKIISNYSYHVDVCFNFKFVFKNVFPEICQIFKYRGAPLLVV